MAKQKARISLTTVRALQPHSSIWDDSLRGFFARRQVDQISYNVAYRAAGGRQRWYTIGRHGALTPDMARREAHRILGLVASGRDPSGEREAERDRMTVAQLCDRYLADSASGRLLRRGKRKKASTLKDDTARVKNHVVPLLGRLPVASVTTADIESFVFSVATGVTAKAGDKRPGPKGGEGAATRTYALLCGIFSYGKKLGLRNDVPTEGVATYASRPRRRRLSDGEYGGLNRALGEGDPIVSFLCLSGWRSGEAAGLQWRDIDIDRQTAFLGDTKTGASTRILGQAAIAIIKAQPRFLHNDLVFPGTRGLRDVTALFDRLRRRNGVARDITPHVLRHSFASTCGDLGYSELIIASLLGHTVKSVTSRYVHLSDPALKRAADGLLHLASHSPAYAAGPARVGAWGVISETAIHVGS